MDYLYGLTYPKALQLSDEGCSHGYLMMAEADSKKDPKSKKPRNSSPAQGPAAVAQRLETFALLPFHGLAVSRKQSVRSFLEEVTGLSKARISKGNLHALRPSTLQKIATHQQQWLHGELKRDPEAIARVEAKIAAAPTLHNEKGAIWATWINQFEFLPDVALTRSKAVALVMDELVEALVSACHDEDLERWKHILVGHLRNHGSAVRVGHASAYLPAQEAELKACLEVNTWAQGAALLSRFMDHWYLDMISTLDAEWSSHYFSGRQTMPLFPLVMVRPQEGLMETMKVSSRKNVFFRPSRRLLEFLYALVFFIRYKRWPAKAPTPKELASILYRPDEKEMAGEELIYNYFDGSTNLTLDLVYDHWVQLFQNFLPERKEGERESPPFPLIMLALQWQVLLVQNKGKSFLLLDMERYETLWRYRRQQWEAEQAERDCLVPQAGHTKAEPIVWPAWMFNQSSSSS